MDESPLLQASIRGDFAAAEAAGWKLAWDHPAHELGLCLFHAAAQGRPDFLQGLRKHGSAQLTEAGGSTDQYRNALDGALARAAEDTSWKALEMLLTQIRLSSEVEDSETLFFLAAGHGRVRNLRVLLSHLRPAHRDACCLRGALRAISTGYLKSAFSLVEFLAASGAFPSVEAAWQMIDREDRYGCVYHAASSRRLHVLRWALACRFPPRGDCLTEAASQQWPEGVKLLLEHGVDPVKTESEALVRAAYDNSPEIARLLVDAGIDTRRAGEKALFGMPPLYQSAVSGSLEVLDVLLNAPGPQAPDSEELEHALELATGGGHVEAARRLRKALEKAAEPGAGAANILVAAAGSGKRELWEDAIRDGLRADVRDSQGRTPLHGAAASGSLEIVRQLIAAGASVNARDENGQTALHQAVRQDVSRDRDPHYRPAEVIRLLLDAGAEMDALDDLGRTPLAEALWTGRVETVRLLLEAGADPMGKGKEIDRSAAETTPLHVAVIQQGEEAISLLIKAGADPNTSDSIGWTPLHWAARGDVMRENLACLLRHGANPNRRDIPGDTPLHIAVTDSRRIDAVKELLAAGAHVSAENEKGNTPLIALCEDPVLAWEAGKMASILLAAGADPHHRNRRGWTALDYAKKHKLKDVVKVLTKAVGRP